MNEKKLIDLNISEFADLLASNSPAPGGGSAAALSAALGAALTNMVCALTIGKKKYAEHEDLAKEISKEVQKITAKLLENIDEDTKAYNAVSAVFSMPKDTEEQKTARKDAMESALKQAATVPCKVMDLCLEALKLTQKAIGRSNPNVLSDLGVAALTLNAGLKGAWMNVLINLSSIKDQNFVTEYKELGSKTLKAGEEIAESVETEVMASLNK